MRIVSARIVGFRNLAELDLEFSSQVNLFLGGNGQGKTNLLEALNYLALGRSHRGATHEELIAFGEDQLYVLLTLEKNDGDRFTFDYRIDRTGARRVRSEGQTLKLRRDLIGHLNTIFFAPSEIRLVRGGPKHRRRFLDQGLATIDPLYLEEISAYQRTVRQKARLLQEIKRGRRALAGAKNELASWNQKLAGHALAVCRGRRQYAESVAVPAARYYVAISDQDQKLEVVYKPRLKTVSQRLAADPKTDLSGGDLERDIQAEFDYIAKDEIQRGRPLTGPQLDDCEVRLAKRDLRAFGSQGETRTAAISLLLAQRDVVYERKNVRPVLFFDDLFSELDRKRSRRLQELTAREHQVFIATAREDDVHGWHPQGLKVWSVTEGRVGRSDGQNRPQISP